MPKLIGDKPLTSSERTKRWREKHPERYKESLRRSKENNPGAANAAGRRHYARNAESEKARSTAWREANREESRRHRRESYYRHRDENLIAMKEWAKKNAAKVRNYQHVRRERAIENGIFSISDKDLNRLVSRPCAECGSVDRIEIDHIIPVSRGGTHGIGNLQPLCYKCNRSKRSRLTVEWRRAKSLVAA